MGRAAARAVGTTNTMRVRFGYPESLGAKAGDEVGLQLVYWPGGHEVLPREGISPAAARASGLGEGVTPVPMLSNTLKFTLTAELVKLCERHRAEAAGARQ
jgi:hypothetical protein